MLTVRVKVTIRIPLITPSQVLVVCSLYSGQKKGATSCADSKLVAVTDKCTHVTRCQFTSIYFILYGSLFAAAYYIFAFSALQNTLFYLYSLSLSLFNNLAFSFCHCLSCFCYTCIVRVSSLFATFGLHLTSHWQRNTVNVMSNTQRL